ncbi:MAG TPA: C40 family peptidase [Candidatus Nanopelagicaceae bacterium]
MNKRQVRIVALCASVFLSIPTVSFAANAVPKPKVSGPTKAQIAAAQIAATQAAKKAQIAAAQAAENAKAAAATSATNQLTSAQNILQQLEEITIHKQAELNSAQIALHGATSRSNVASAHATLTRVAVVEANKTIGRMAANAYILGGGFTTLNSVLESSGPQDLIDRLSILNQVGATDAVALTRYKSAMDIARTAQQAAKAAKQTQAAATAKVAAAKATAVAAQSAQTDEVAKLRAVQAQLMAELATARHVRITLQQQLALWQLEQSSANTASHTKGQARIWPDRGFKGRSTTRGNDSIRTKALAYAKEQVLARKPYVWGAQGPNSFDCSGLVYAAYRSAGLGYPNWSRLNAALYFVDSERIPLTNLIPGDLLFYSYDGSVQNIHHITIYAGNGMMWEANGTRTGLLYSNMYSVPGLMPSGGRV